jgi:group I intron endonuclease
MAGNYILYEHRNKINGKRYIGITNNKTKRWYGKGKHYDGCPYFWAAIQKYGWDSFEHKVLIYDLTREEASRLEKHYIKMLKTCDKSFGYNLAEGGVNAPTMLGKHHSEETKRKMREAQLGRTISEERKKRQSEAMTGLMVGSRNHKSRAVRCINTGEVFESMRIAAQTKGVLQPKIWKCCNGEASHTHGLRWEYADATEVN